MCLGVIVGIAVGGTVVVIALVVLLVAGLCRGHVFNK